MPMKTVNILLFAAILLLSGCSHPPVPKPYGFFRVDLPTPEYQLIDTTLPYRFELSHLAEIHLRTDANERYWIDIRYPSLNAIVHCNYNPVDNNIYELSEDARTFVYKHIVKADHIGEQTFRHPAQNVFGVFYDLKGNTASAAQFVLTDSSRHFFRGALYFNHVPNKDSIAPMAEYLKRDLLHLMESFSWK